MAEKTTEHQQLEIEAHDLRKEVLRLNVLIDTIANAKTISRADYETKLEMQKKRARKWFKEASRLRRILARINKSKAPKPYIYEGDVCTKF